MSIKRCHESMDKLDKCYKIVLQSSSKGTSAVDIAEKLGVHRTTVHRYINSLELMGKVENRLGAWYAKTGEQTIKPLEKEIVIELPIPKKEWRRMALLESMSKELDIDTARICLEKLKETRTIRIKGKNVDDLDLQKLGNLIQQANGKSSKFSLKGLFKNLKRSRAIDQ